MNIFSSRRRNCQFLALVCLCLAATGMADQVAPIPAFEAGYSVYREGIPVGEAALQLEYRDDGGYRMRSSLRIGLTGVLEALSETEEVEGIFVDGLPRPLRYRAQRTGSKERTVSADFSWKCGEVTTVVNGKEASLELEPRMVDPLSLYLLAMLDMRSGGTSSEYLVVARGRLKTYYTRALGQTTIGASIGDMATHEVSWRRLKSSKATTFWYAPELDFLPVQITRIKAGEEKARLVIDRLTR